MFEWVGQELEKRTALSRLEARGTVRLVLRDAGLEPGTVTVSEMVVVLRRLMTPALEKRRVEDAADVCKRVTELLEAIAQRGLLIGRESAYEVFRRMDGRSDDEEEKR